MVTVPFVDFDLPQARAGAFLCLRIPGIAYLQDRPAMKVLVSSENTQETPGSPAGAGTPLLRKNLSLPFKAIDGGRNVEPAEALEMLGGSPKFG